MQCQIIKACYHHNYQIHTSPSVLPPEPHRMACSDVIFLSIWTSPWSITISETTIERTYNGHLGRFNVEIFQATWKYLYKDFGKFGIRLLLRLVQSIWKDLCLKYLFGYTFNDLLQSSPRHPLPHSEHVNLWHHPWTSRTQFRPASALPSSPYWRTSNPFKWCSFYSNITSSSWAYNTGCGMASDSRCSCNAKSIRFFFSQFYKFLFNLLHYPGWYQCCKPQTLQTSKSKITQEWASEMDSCSKCKQT